MSPAVLFVRILCFRCNHIHNRFHYLFIRRQCVGRFISVSYAAKFSARTNLIFRVPQTYNVAASCSSSVPIAAPDPLQIASSAKYTEIPFLQTQLTAV